MRWAGRLRLDFPLLADPDRAASTAFGVLRKLRVAAWTIELLERATFLVDRGGKVAAVWTQVKIRGHAREVLDAALALEAAERSDPLSRGPASEGPPAP